MATKTDKPAVTNYNDEIVQVFEELKVKYEEIEKEIAFTEQRKLLLTQNVAMMTEKLEVVVDNLAKKTQARDEYTKTIEETEMSYGKICDSTKTLLHVLKRESGSLDKLI